MLIIVKINTKAKDQILEQVENWIFINGIIKIEDKIFIK